VLLSYFSSLSSTSVNAGPMKKKPNKEPNKEQGIVAN